LNDRDFVPLEIDSGDSQPYDTWARKAHKSPHKQLGTKHRPIPLRNVIYLLPLGEFDETIAPPLELLRKWCAAYFFGLRVELLEAIPSKSEKMQRIKKSYGRLGCSSIFSILTLALPADGFCIAAITMKVRIPTPASMRQHARRCAAGALQGGRGILTDGAGHAAPEGGHFLLRL